MNTKYKSYYIRNVWLETNYKICKENQKLHNIKWNVKIKKEHPKIMRGLLKIKFTTGTQCKLKNTKILLKVVTEYAIFSGIFSIESISDTG